MVRVPAMHHPALACLVPICYGSPLRNRTHGSCTLRASMPDLPESENQLDKSLTQARRGGRQGDGATHRRKELGSTDLIGDRPCSTSNNHTH